VPRPLRHLGARAPLLAALLAAVTLGALAGCQFSDIPGFAPPPAAVDTTTPPPPRSIQTWLDTNSTTVRSIDFTDRDFGDLAPLRDAIGEARIVMLGEQTRADGATLRAKARLVRYLHEELGFDVLVFESGLYEMREAWARIEAGLDGPAALQASVSEPWRSAQALQPLFAYVGDRARTSRPLIVAGVDPQFTGPASGGAGASFVGDLEAFLDTHASPLPSAPWWPAFRALTQRMATRATVGEPFSTAERDAFRDGVRTLKAETNRLVNIAPERDAAFWITAVLSLEAAARVAWAERDGNADAAAGIRDSSMAESLVWLAQSAYPDRKFLVWTTSAHNLRTPLELFTVQGQPEGHERAVFGALARVTLGEPTIYSLGFLAGTGVYGPLQAPANPAFRDLVRPLPESWDGLFLATGKPFAFLHLRRQPTEDNAWIYAPRIARALGYQQFVARWPFVYDGFFFTAEMTPVTRVP
jgi:erythromycin esterase